MPAYSAVIDLAGLTSAQGFRIDGVAAGDRSGFSLSSAGDVNGDGFDDIIVGAPYADPTDRNGGGSAYVVLGTGSGASTVHQLSSLNGSNGFRLDGVSNNDGNAYSVASAGDFNGDGFDDIIVGAEFAESPAGRWAGASYLVFGKSGGFSASMDLSQLNGGDGFAIAGLAPEDYSGNSVASAGDVNGDGFDDIIIGAHGADPGGDVSAGSSYVVFGKASGFSASLDLALLDGSNGFRLDGAAATDGSGSSVASAGDINGDGFNDLIVGAGGADPGGVSTAGSSYVVFGKASGFAATLDLSALDGSSGFRLDGVALNDVSGFAVACAGDINGDGYDDLIVGAPFADPGGKAYAGSSYLVFGKASGFAATMDLAALDGDNGFRLDGVAAGDQSGITGASAGDVNGDGFDDIIIGARYADGAGATDSGCSYVVFGAEQFSAVLELAQLDGDSGFRIEGAVTGDRSGWCVAAGGDMNNDGLADLLVGAPYADPNAVPRAGSSYVVYGMLPSEAVVRIGSVIGQTIRGGAFDDLLAGKDGDDILLGGAGADRLDGGRGDDAIEGGKGKDTLLGRNGADTMTGGRGGDAFVFRSATDSNGSTLDRITDLEASDTIKLSKIDADIATAGDQAFALVAAFTGQAGEVVLTFQAGLNQTLLEGDIDGDGLADLVIVLDGDQTGHANFVL